MLDYGKLVEEFEQHMFYNKLCKTLLNECRDEEDFVPYNIEFLEAKKALKKLLSAENKKLLKEAEDTAFNYCRYSVTFAFRRGLYTGFEQVFSDSPLSHPYRKRVRKELDTVNEMKRHKRYYDLRMSTVNFFEEIQALFEDDDIVKEHIISVCTAWEEWAECVLRHGFYLGYRYALSVCDKVDYRKKREATPHILTTEYELLFCFTMEELEIQTRGPTDEQKEFLLDNYGHHSDDFDDE